MTDARWTAPLARGHSAFARLHFRTLEEQVIQVGECEVYKVAEEPRSPLAFDPFEPSALVRVRVIALRLRLIQQRGPMVPTNRYGATYLLRAGVPEWASVELVQVDGRAYTHVIWREYHEEPPVGWWAKRCDFAARRKAIRRRMSAHRLRLWEAKRPPWMRCHHGG